MIPRSFIPRARSSVSKSVRARSFNSNVFFSHLTVLAAVENGLVCGTRDLHVSLRRASGGAAYIHTHTRTRIVASRWQLLYVEMSGGVRLAQDVLAVAREGIARWKRQEGRKERERISSFFYIPSLSLLPPSFPPSPSSLPTPSSLFIRSVREQALEVAAACDPRLYMLMLGHDEQLHGIKNSFVEYALAASFLSNPSLSLSLCLRILSAYRFLADRCVDFSSRFLEGSVVFLGSFVLDKFLLYHVFWLDFSFQSIILDDLF